ncbi:hypothetical protein [Nocardia sp. NPDC051981]|uniref:hypothetical protein n=1 Tax=Nocardia sp. NPDC051981 TaxID=3155417 RepID=UPI0034487752
MGTVVVLGEASQVSGYCLAGATVLAVEDAEAARKAWASLDSEVAVVLMSTRASGFLAAELADTSLLTAVMPS